MVEGAHRNNKKRSTQAVIALLVGLVAFAALLQSRQSSDDVLASLRQSELVRIIDELTAREQELTAERDLLRAELADLESGITDHEVALAAAEKRKLELAIQAGTVAVEGPGMVITVRDSRTVLKAHHLVSLIEELRNAGAEAIAISGVRVGANTWVRDGFPLVLDGIEIRAPYTVQAIGDSNTMGVALEMPGGVLASFRTLGALTEIDEQSRIEITAIRTIRPLEHGRVVE